MDSMRMGGGSRPIANISLRTCPLYICTYIHECMCHMTRVNPPKTYLHIYMYISMYKKYTHTHTHTHINTYLLTPMPNISPSDIA
jgi:hypothetical protein